MLQRFFSDRAARRASSALSKLSRHNVENWALAGSLALEIQCALAGHPSQRRALNDLDFVTDSFDHLPGTLAADFLFRHVHPADPLGRVMLQMVDSENALRIDVFCTTGSIMSRSTDISIGALRFRLISTEDALARNVRVLLSLAENEPVASKYALDFVRLRQWDDSQQLQFAWQDHRHGHHPADFVEAKRVVQKLIRSRPDLLIEPRYSTDVKSVCLRCKSIGAFPLADAQQIMSILGYC